MTNYQAYIPFKMKNHSILMMLFCIFIVVFSANSNATCIANPSDILTSTPNLSYMRDIPVNSQIGNDFSSNISTIYTCDAIRAKVQYGLKTYGIQIIGNINGRTIFSTKINGIGFAAGIQLISPATCGNAILWIDGTNTGDGNPFNRLGCEILNDTTTNVTARFYFALYKTSAVVDTGSLPNGPAIGLRSIIYLNSTWPSSQSETYVYLNPYKLSVQTCSVSNPASVTLPTISAPSSLSQINSTSGVRNFTLNINCPTQTNVAITFTDNNDKTQTGNILTPDASSTATGVAIQLKYLNSVIAFGPDSGTPGNTNQILLNSNLTGTQSFPFSAYYIRTGAVTPGTLSSSATFSMSYQ